MSAQWSRLTEWLNRQDGARVRIRWGQLDAIVGGLPASASIHSPWWHGDRSHTRAWRAAGYELDHVEVGVSVTLRRVGGPVCTLGPPVPEGAGVDVGGTTQSAVLAPRRLPDGDPGRAMIVLQCSGRKALGGESWLPFSSPWPDELLDARRPVAKLSELDTSMVMPAWERYTGGFYETCRPTLARAVAAGANIVILSGGYGVVTATEPIGFYKKVLKLSDWRSGALERALLGWAGNTSPETVVAFVSRTTDYARLVRRTPWHRLGLPAYLVTAQVSDGGAMGKVPRALGKAFAAYWSANPEGWPDDAAVERL